jgi:hypothetical protein
MGAAAMTYDLIAFGAFVCAWVFAIAVRLR